MKAIIAEMKANPTFAGFPTCQHCDQPLLPGEAYFCSKACEDTVNYALLEARETAPHAPYLLPFKGLHHEPGMETTSEDLRGLET